MLFNSLSYLLFLPLVVLAYWLAPQAFRLPLLLVASYTFYMSWKPEYGLLLLGLTLLNYLAGFVVRRDGASKKSNRLFFISAIALNLALLVLFKYTNFFINSYWSFANFFASQPGETPIATPSSAELPIILPLGISFFVFEFVHYLTDVYMHKASPIKSPLRFGVFAAFFPSQIAGPIKRFEDFDKQALQEKRFDFEQFQIGLFLIVQGLFKKVVLGDNLSTLADVGFANCHNINSIDAWAAVAAFTLQIYYDFSGYTDIGVGSAKLLGYQLPENFNMPYIAKSMSEFWHRWHISLSTWLRDYLYIPLGGSKAGSMLQMRNLVITMLLGGLWHGASWTFVLWGAFQGVGLVISHSWDSTAKKIAIFQKNELQILWSTFSWLLTIVFVMFGWVLFRAESIEQALAVFNAMLAAGKETAYDFQVLRMFTESTLPLAFSLYIIFHIVLNWAARSSELDKHGTNTPWYTWLTLPIPARAFFLAGVSGLILGLSPQKGVPFIYFQF